MMHLRRSADSTGKIAWTRRAKVLSAVMGCALAGGVAFAATNWTVGLTPGSNGQGQSATIAPLTITASATPAASNLLYPGGTGDVVVSISNPNAFPVTITAVNLPASTVYAAGYSNGGLTTAVAGCTATTSLVSWNFATSTSGTSHTLSTPIVVGASGQSSNPVVVTLTNDATMTSASPAACANSYFSMPSLTAITATGGAATVSNSPMTSGWTS
jgi:hypothetical protein